MCSYCGCQALPVIRLLTLQHEEIVNTLGQVRRCAEAGDSIATTSHARDLAALLAVHNALEEKGLFQALSSDGEFAETLAKLKQEHVQIDDLVTRVISGEFSFVRELDRLLRDNMSNEENGLFPATAVTLDGWVWDRIEIDFGVANPHRGV